MLPTSQPMNPQEASMPRSNIIIVDDDPSNAEVLDLLLHATLPYRTTCFYSSHDVLTNLNTIRLLNPILFILDYRLPPLTGLEVYQRLHAIEELAHVPAIIVSGSIMNGEEQDTVLGQGLIFISKPYDIDDMLATIEQVVG